MVCPDVGERRPHQTSRARACKRQRKVLRAFTGSEPSVMRDVLSEVLVVDARSGGEDPVDRILAAAFFRKRPLQAGVSAHVISLTRGEQGNVKKEGERR